MKILLNPTEVIIPAEHEHVRILDVQIGESNSPVNVHLSAHGSSCEIVGLHVGVDSAVGVMRHRVHHSAPQTSSTLRAKIILDDEAQLQFAAGIQIETQARQATGDQRADVLLLSGQAKIQTDPTLQIGNRHVQCAHGVSITNLSEEKLFYAKSRGLGSEEAHAVMIRAHLEPVLDLLGPHRKSIEERLKKYGL